MGAQAVSQVGNARRLQRMERMGGAKDGEWLTAVREIGREQRAALALVKLAQALAGTPPPATPMPVREETPRPVEPSPAPGRESAPPVISGSTNDPYSSAYIRPWVQEAVAPEMPDGPDMPTGPWAHWGFEPPPSYARDAEEGADDE